MNTKQHTFESFEVAAILSHEVYRETGCPTPNISTNLRYTAKPIRCSWVPQFIFNWVWGNSNITEITLTIVEHAPKHGSQK